LYMGPLAVAMFNSFRTEFSLKIGVAPQGNPERYGTWKTIQPPQGKGFFCTASTTAAIAVPMVFKTPLRSSLLPLPPRKNHPGHHGSGNGWCNRVSNRICLKIRFEREVGLTGSWEVAGFWESKDADRHRESGDA